MPSKRNNCAAACQCGSEGGLAEVFRSKIVAGSRDTETGVFLIVLGGNLEGILAISVSPFQSGVEIPG